MSKKINPVNGREIDPIFDGHLEKPLSEMTPEEKLKYLWMQIEFKWAAEKAIRIKSDDSLGKKNEYGGEENGAGTIK